MCRIPGVADVVFDGVLHHEVVHVGGGPGVSHLCPFVSVIAGA